MQQDYCTGWFEGSWAHCCKAHDLAYDSGIARQLADTALEQCVAATGNSLMAWVMLIGVSLCGWIFYPRGKSKKE